MSLLFIDILGKVTKVDKDEIQNNLILSGEYQMRLANRKMKALEVFLLLRT